MNSDNRLGTDKVLPLFFRLSLPAVVAQVINLLYNIVDRIYIGRMEGIGATALTGVGVCFPIILFVAAFAGFAGQGGAPLASMKLGAGDKESAERFLGNSAMMLITSAVTLTVLFQIFKEPMLYAFGASDSTIIYSLDYITIYLWGTIFVQFALGLNTYISVQGAAKVAMLSVCIGAALNILLDPVFIFMFDMGVKGAALATVISQAVSAVWVVSFLMSEKSAIRLRRKHLRPNKSTILKIAALGVSPFIMQSTESLISIVFNSGLQNYGGDLYVGSMTILTSVMQMITLPLQGFGQGVQAIISYNYGANKPERVKEAFKICFTVTLTVATSFTLLVFVFPHFFAGIFTDEAALVELTAKWAPVFFGGVWLFGAQIACQNTFLALGQAKISLFLALLRKVFLLVPLAYFLPMFFGVGSIYVAEPISDSLAAITTTIIFFSSYKKILERRGR